MDVTSKIGQSVAEKAFSEAGKGASSGNMDFEKVLSEKLDKSSGMNQKVLEAFGMDSKPMELKSVSAEGLEISPNQISSQQEIRTHGKTMDLLTDVNRSALQMDDMIQLTLSKKLSPQELLALQAGMHQIVLEVELAGKTVEQGSNSLKQTLQTQI